MAEKDYQNQVDIVNTYLRKTEEIDPFLLEWVKEKGMRRKKWEKKRKKDKKKKGKKGGKNG